MRARADESFIKAEGLHSRIIIADGMAGQQAAARIRRAESKSCSSDGCQGRSMCRIWMKRQRDNLQLGRAQPSFMFAQPWFGLHEAGSSSARPSPDGKSMGRIERALLQNPAARYDQIWQSRTNSRPLNPALHGIRRNPNVKPMNACSSYALSHLSPAPRTSCLEY